jgi:hypothetical protein
MPLLPDGREHSGENLAILLRTAVRKASPDKELDRLFALPLDEFTAARNAAVKRLKETGDDEAAEQVGALTKPSVPVWAINQLARKEKAAVRGLLEAAAKLRKACSGRG